MRVVNTSVTRVLSLAAVVAVVVSIAGAAFARNGQMDGQTGDKRKLTTIQTASLDLGGKKNAVEVKYLNVPFGEKTFSYLEVGGDDYYSTRTWPIAHLKLGTSASLGGKTLAAGDYVLYVTPKSGDSPMALTYATFKPDASGTFLVAGNVFVDTPKDAVEVVKVPAAFTKGDPSIDHLEIAVAKAGSGAEIKVHYGNRWLTQTLEAK
jgi:hypothetical protein